MKNKGSAPSGTGPFIIPINDIPKTTFYNLHQYLSSIFHASAYLFHGVRPRLDIIFQFYIAIDRPFLLFDQQEHVFQRHLPLSPYLIRIRLVPCHRPRLVFQVDTIDPIMIFLDHLIRVDTCRAKEVARVKIQHNRRRDR